MHGTFRDLSKFQMIRFVYWAPSYNDSLKLSTNSVKYCFSIRKMAFQISENQNIAMYSVDQSGIFDHMYCIEPGSLLIIY